MFRGRAAGLSFAPRDGDMVVLRGAVGVYERGGTYQLVVSSIRPDGTGSLYEAYVKLANDLREAGYFDPARKKPLPRYPRAVAVITSPTGAVVRDVISVVTRRSPSTSVIVCPVSVQGEGAAEEIASMLDYVNSKLDVDVIVVGRGGGSIEELWAFNEPIVADAVLRSKIPVVSAVGHETDSTICDFVADVRAPTPSAAAEMIVADKTALLSGFASAKSRLASAVLARVDRAQRDVMIRSRAGEFVHPLALTDRKGVEIAFALRKLTESMERALKDRSDELRRARGILESASPAATLSRGYAALVRAGEYVSADDLVAGDEITIKGLKMNAIAAVSRVDATEDN
jgi:exodeoxyribonuclease VII large subunit